jgi:AraC-like DNA-binding protein
MLNSETGLKLSDRYTRVATRDLAEASPAIEKLQGAFLARPAANRSACERPVHVRAAVCGHVAISTFQFGRSLEIVPHGLAGAVLVTTAIAGRAGLTSNRGVYGAECGATFVSQEEDSPVFMYDPDTEVLKLRFERSRFEKFGAKLHDHAPHGDLRFDYRMPSEEASNRWVALLRFVVATLNAAPSQMEMASMEELLMMTLLSIQPGNYHVERMAPVGKISPRQFRQAVDYIQQHLEADIRLSDVAEAASCSIRSLTRAFHLASDTTPMQYLHGLRLQRVRAELSQTMLRDKTIADIAYRWGFRHLGEFNRRYRETFGETPSETRVRVKPLC